MRCISATSRAALFVLLGCSLLLGACSGQDQRSDHAPTSQSGNNGIVVARTGEAVSFHPYKTTDTASAFYQGLVYAGGLVTRDPDNVERFIPEMAERWEESPDHRVYTFHLRPDLMWSDGVPLTAYDFQWTYEQASKPENGYPYITNLEPIESYEAVDERTIRVTLREPLAIGLEQADAISPPLPKHIWEQYDWNSPDRNPEILKPTVGSGPFLLQSWTRDERAVFVANPRYFKGRPKLDTFTVRIAGTPQIAFQWLRAGEVDESGFPPENYAEAKQLSNITVYEWWPATGNWSYIGFNLATPALQDVRVRRALAHAINRDAIIERVMFNLARPIDSAYGPSCWCYTPDVPKREYNPDRARQLLDEAGWPVGPDGIRTKDGQRLQLRLIYGPASSRVRASIAQVAQEAFRQVGVAVDIIQLEWGTYLARQRDPSAWDLSVAGWQATIDPHWMYQIWSEENIPDLNAGGYRNPQVEALYKQAAREFDQERRKQLYFEIQRILAEDQPYIFLFQDLSYTGVNNRVGGIRPTPLGIEYNLHEWYIK
jgi:peptide/nickel transport system substrate-binding protein